MRVLAPIPVTDAVLISSTVPETPPAAYAAGTTYALGAECSTGAPGGVISVWRSLAADNIGHDPAASPSWWATAGDTYSLYDAGTAWADGAYVIDSAAHLVYKSIVAGNLGNPLSDATKWQPQGPTNRYAMFDTRRNTRTVAPGSITVRLAPGRRCDSICMAGVAADAASATVYLGAAVEAERTWQLGTRFVTGWYSYFTAPFARRDVAVAWDLPPWSAAEIEVVFSADEGNVEVGALGVGISVHLGGMRYGANASGINFTDVARDDWSNAIVRVARNVPTTDQVVWVEKARAEEIRALLTTDLNGQVAFWSGLDDWQDGYFAPYFIVGFVREFDLNADYPRQALLSLKLEEI